MRDLSTLQDQSFDLIIIGGGINGAGTAREAALQGLKTLLIEKGDFGSGTTSWSSRLAHGGLRYLEYFEFNLVRESLREREVLLRNAPHLVRPIQMTIPIYQGNKRGPQLVRAGMVLYDILSYDKTLPGHRMLGRQPFAQLYRGVNQTRLAGAAQYYDGQVEYAERLCWENILAAKEAGATVLNYVTVERLEQDGQRISAIALRDSLGDSLVDSLGDSQKSPDSGQRITLETHDAIVINTAGPWVDHVCRSTTQEGQAAPVSQERLIGGTKGSHIVVEPFPGAPDGALYVEAESDGRPYFILPWLDKYLIGTTDLRFSGDLDAFKASNDEIDYLIDETNRVLPNARLSRDQVTFTYSGVRPLPYSDGQKTSSITRSHILRDHGKSNGINNLISLIGGKLTTYRQVGDDLVEAAQKKLGRSVSSGKTKTLPLPGAVGLSSEAIAQAIQRYAAPSSPSIDPQNGRPAEVSIPTSTIHYLFKLYGSRATAVLRLTDENPDLARPIVPELPDIHAQVVYAVREEMAHTLVDICCRRTLIAMLANYGLGALAPISETLRRHCGWSEADCDRHRQAYQTYIETTSLPDYAIAESARGNTAPSDAPLARDALVSEASP